MMDGPHDDAGKLTEIPSILEHKSYLRRFQLLSFVGLITSFYLLYHHVSVRGGFQLEQSACSINASLDCDKVARSPFAEIVGLPLASLGIFYYVLWFAVTQRFLQSTGKQLREILLFTVGASTLGLSFSLIFLFLSVVFIHSLCIVCSLTYIIDFLLLFLALKAPWISEAQNGNKKKFRLIGDSLFGILLLPLGKGALAGLTSFFYVVLIVTAIFILPAPQSLVRFHFKPQQLARFDEMALAPLINDWEKQPVTDIKLIEGSAENSEISFGPVEAPVTIIEFSDFECAFCQRAAKYLDMFFEKYDTQVRFVYKNFPLDMSCNRMVNAPKHEYACKAAIAGRCAWIQSPHQFKTFAHHIFAAGNLSDEKLARISQDVGLASKKYSECLASETTVARVKADVEAGVAAGVQGTPAIFVNGKRLSARPELLPGVLALIVKKYSTKASSN